MAEVLISLVGLVKLVVEEASGNTLSSVQEAARHLHDQAILVSLQTSSLQHYCMIHSPSNVPSQEIWYSRQQYSIMKDSAEKNSALQHTDKQCSRAKAVKGSAWKGNERHCSKKHEKQCKTAQWRAVEGFQCSERHTEQ